MVTLEEARHVIAAAERKAKDLEQPMNIAVADAGGNLIAHVRMDEAWIGSIDISIKKAFTARAFDVATKDLAKFSQSGGAFFGIHASNEGRVMIFAGGVPLKPIMRRALHMGDELHSRNTAASLLFSRELFPHLLAIAERQRDGVEKTMVALTEDNYFFLRLSMAAAKATADAAHGVEGSSLVSAMTISCKEFAIRVSGLGDKWFGGPHPSVQAKLFKGHTEAEITWMGGESIIAETIGLGGFAQAAAFPLQAYQGGAPTAMVERNVELYRITVGENTDYHIPFLSYRGTPTGIDLFKVLETGVMPMMDVGVAGRDGGQIGAGVVRAARDCFERAAEAYRAKYGRGTA